MVDLERVAVVSGSWQSQQRSSSARTCFRTARFYRFDAPGPRRSSGRGRCDRDPMAPVTIGLEQPTSPQPGRAKLDAAARLSETTCVDDNG